MTNKERMLSEMAYFCDKDLFEEQKLTRKLIHKFNTTDPSDFDSLSEQITQIFGKCGKATFVNPPFHCDYGTNIEVGNNFFANYNCCILDVAKVVIGDNCFFAPNVSIYTAGHPIHHEIRNTGYEYGIGITIGSNVWIGGNTVICPGVHIGNGCVIGAGSVVTHDIPDMTVAAGNPCKVIRKITDEDKQFYFKNRKIDDEAMEIIKSKIDEE